MFPSFLVGFLGCILALGAVSGDKKSCELKTSWGGNACNLNETGSFEVKSSPGSLPVTQEKCDLFYQKEEFKQQPEVMYKDAESGEIYTVAMVDPDAPSHPEGQYWLHWIAANIPGEDLKKGDLKNAKMITAYRGPTPPQGTGTHRYMLVVFRHDNPSLKVVREVPDSQRRLFDLGAWAAGHHLCGPLAGLQFRTNHAGQEIQ